MEGTSVSLGGVALASSIMNASGAHSGTRSEILDLGAAHSGAVVFKSCNINGLETPENLKNPGIEHFRAVARELAAKGRVAVGSAIGASDDEIVSVAAALSRAKAQIIELNLADDYVISAIQPFASADRLSSLLGRVRNMVDAALAVKVPARLTLAPSEVADVFRANRVAVAVCANDLPKDLKVDIATGLVQGPQRRLSQAGEFFGEAAGAFDIVAVGGIGSGHDAYIAHLNGAKAVQVGSALVKGGPAALARIDHELNDLLSRNGKRSVSDILGQIRFAT